MLWIQFSLEEQPKHTPKMAAIQCDERTASDFKYRRFFWDEEKKTFTLIEIYGGEFSSVYVPDNYVNFYRDMFSSAMPVKGANHLQALHHSRKHDKCFSVVITKAPCEPQSFKPFVWPDGVKRKVQYLLLDVDMMIAFLQKLPEYVEDIIPCVVAQAKPAEVEQLDPYATFTTKSQVRGSCILKEITSARKEIHKLELSLVQFSQSYSLQLRYMMAQGTVGYGCYMSQMVYEWLMESRDLILNAALRIKEEGNKWSAVDTASFKRDMEECAAPWPDDDEGETESLIKRRRAGSEEDNPEGSPSSMTRSSSA